MKIKYEMVFTDDLTDLEIELEDYELDDHATDYTYHLNEKDFLTKESYNNFIESLTREMEDWCFDAFYDVDRIVKFEFSEENKKKFRETWDFQIKERIKEKKEAEARGEERNNILNDQDSCCYLDAIAQSPYCRQCGRNLRN